MNASLQPASLMEYYDDTSIKHVIRASRSRPGLGTGRASVKYFRHFHEVGLPIEIGNKHKIQPPPFINGGGFFVFESSPGLNFGV